MCLRRRLPALLDQCPERRVIEIVDVRIRLPPSKVVANVLRLWVGHYPSVERWWVLQRFVREVLGPVQDVARCEVGSQGRHDLRTPTIIEARRPLEEEAAPLISIDPWRGGILSCSPVFIRLPESQNDVWILLHNAPRCMVHELKRP